MSVRDLAGGVVRTDPLAIYLNDHLAGATAGAELARRLAGAHRGTPLQEPLETLAVEVTEDREALLAMMRVLGVPARHYKVAAGWVAEKVGRLKPNGRLVSRSPLSTVVELEGMRLGVEGKACLWRTLRALVPARPELDQGEIERLLGRAREQIAGLERLRAAESTAVFGG